MDDTPQPLHHFCLRGFVTICIQTQTTLQVHILYTGAYSQLYVNLQEMNADKNKLRGEKQPFSFFLYLIMYRHVFWGIHPPQQKH